MTKKQVKIEQKRRMGMGLGHLNFQYIQGILYVSKKHDVLSKKIE